MHRLQNMHTISQAETLIEHASEEVRRISHAMMPDALINLG
jgi:signal transduction histidine kinase